MSVTVKELMSEFHSSWIPTNQFYVPVEGVHPSRWELKPRPVIVCLCGSTRFYEAFQKANYEETMAGKIVLSVGHYPHSSEQAHGESVGCTPEQKIALDELHKRKIDLADEVLILNCKWWWCPNCQMHCHPPVAGRTRCCNADAAMRPYIGSSTRSELEYARNNGKTIRFLEPEKVT